MKVGLDVLVEDEPELLADARVALVSHQAAVGRCGATAAQLLHRVLGDRLVALFGPEHGYFRVAGPGEETADSVHPDWGIPVYSLYGATRKPTPEMLSGIDTLVVDLQDLGVRCYTYLATLHLVLQACGECGVRVIVADRPVPLHGTVDGPGLDPAFASFVAPLPLPMVYGMTPGETARWMLAKQLVDADVTVADIRETESPARPEFIPPSPGIRTAESAVAYAATVFTEAIPAIDCGRGTSLAFRVLGAPWIRAEAFCEAIAGESCEGVSFSPHRYAATGGLYDGRPLDGVRLTVTDKAVFKPVRTSLRILRVLQDLYGVDTLWKSPGVRPEWFDKLYGNRETRECLRQGASCGELFAKFPSCV